MGYPENHIHGILDLDGQTVGSQSLILELYRVSVGCSGSEQRMTGVERVDYHILLTGFQGHLLLESLVGRNVIGRRALARRIAVVHLLQVI